MKRRTFISINRSVLLVHSRHMGNLNFLFPTGKKKKNQRKPEVRAPCRNKNHLVEHYLLIYFFKLSELTNDDIWGPKQSHGCDFSLSFSVGSDFRLPNTYILESVVTENRDFSIICSL